MNYNTLILSGGSICTLKTLGAIQCLMDNNAIDDVNTISGSSAGAMIAYLICIGYTPTEIILYLCTHNIFDHVKSLDIVSMINGSGAISFAGFHEHLEMMTINKIGRLVTFKDVYEKFGKRLVMTTYNYSKKCMEVLDHEHTPDMPCLVGIHMSCCLPFIFNMYKYNNSFYLDGGICDDMPLHLIRREDSKILGIYIDLCQEQDEEKYPDSNIEFLYKLLLIPREYKVHEDERDTDIIKLSSNIETFFRYQMNVVEKLKMFSDGYQQAKEFITKF